MSPHHTVRPLLVTADPQLLDELLRLTSTAGVEAEVAHDPAVARSAYATAPLVLFGTDQMQAGIRAHLPQHANVVVVCQDAHDPVAWECAQPLGAAHVALLPDAEPWLLDRLTEAARAHAAPGGGKVITVLGGRGGAGASVLAAGLAVTASRARLRTLLIDGDPLGGGADLLFGWEEVRGLRWPQLVRANGQVDPAELMGALPGRGDLAVLSCGRSQPDDDPQPGNLPVEAMSAALEAGRRIRDLILVDLPRRFDDASALALHSADHALLIVPAELRAIAAAARVADAVRAHRTELSLIVRGPAPGGLGARELADALGLPLAGQLRAEPRLAAALERGHAPAAGGKGSFAGTCRRLIQELAS